MLYFQGWQGWLVENYLTLERKWGGPIKNINPIANIYYNGDNLFYSDFNSLWTKLLYNLPKFIRDLNVGNQQMNSDCHDVNGYYGILLASQGVNPWLSHLTFDFPDSIPLVPIGHDLESPEAQSWNTHFLAQPLYLSEYPAWDAVIAYPNPSIPGAYIIPLGMHDDDYRATIFDTQYPWSMRFNMNIEIDEGVGGAP
jgi:hypothetical protein